MPNIRITEQDTTSPGANALGTDVVYIPGFASITNTDYPDNDIDNRLEAGVPTLFTSVDEFEAKCGKNPYKYTADQTYPEFTVDGVLYRFSDAALPTETKLVKKDELERTYLYAKELIKLNVPVLYEVINDSTTEPNIEALYKKLLSEDQWTKLEDLGEYSPKYLTTGGYPTLEFCSWKDSTDQTETKVEAHTITEDEVTAHAFTLSNIPIKGVTTLSIGPEGSATTYTIEYTGDPVADTKAIANKTTGVITFADEDTKFVKDAVVNVEYTVAKKVEDTQPIVNRMTKLAETRGDCVAFLDHTNKPERPLTGTSSLYNVLNVQDGAFNIENRTFTTIMTPWADYSSSFSTTSIAFPASFAYFTCLAKSLQINPNWLAIAGVTRGRATNIKNILTNQKLTNKIADSYQERDEYISINAITDIKPYGQTIWGNRTAKDNKAARNLVATSFLNIRNMVSDIKKIAYTTAKRLTFEQNNDILWVNFKAGIQPTLDNMVSGAGLSWYKIIKRTPANAAKATMYATIRIYPIFAVEDFDIEVIMADDEVSVN